MIAADALKNYVTNIETINDQMSDLKEESSQIFKDAKNDGFDTKILRKIIAIRKKSEDELTEEEQLIKLYMDALEGKN